MNREKPLDEDKVYKILDALHDRMSDMVRTMQNVSRANQDGSVDEDGVFDTKRDLRILIGNCSCKLKELEELVNDGERTVVRAEDGAEGKDG